jgi:hypothetical protein
MAKIFLTGMTAPQTSMSANAKNLSFTGVLYKALTQEGHDVTWGDPEISVELGFYDDFDCIIVGVSPITSLSANKAYGALKLINAFWGSNKLRLLIDAPQTNQLAVSFRSIISNPASLVKPFFSYRKNYSLVCSDEGLKKEIFNGVSNLLNLEWPITIYPKLPWKSIDAAKSKLPENIAKNFVGVNLDSYIIEPELTEEDRVSKWVSDEADSYWTKRTLKTLLLPISPMKVNKGSTDQDALNQIKRSIGCLITPHKNDGTWWTYRYIQAINSLTPVVTEWKESMALGPEWAMLGASLETYSQEQKNLLAMAQREIYIVNIPNKKESKNILEKILGLR